MTAYYNEHDAFAAAWLRENIADGLIAPGVVDERSIEDVRTDELAGFAQHHFFAGIGVWSLALRAAGWPDDRPVWTGSCPCQPFSAAGEGLGFDDERHLWPAFHWLIKQYGPAIVLGEQVASKRADPWIDLVQADVEALGYAFGCVPFPAAGVGAPHIRDRAYWVADAMRNGAGYGTRGRLVAETAADGSDGRLSRERLRAGLESAFDRLADMCGKGLPVGSIAEIGRGDLRHEGQAASARDISGGLGNAELPEKERQRSDRREGLCEQEAAGLAGGCLAGGLDSARDSAGVLCGMADPDGGNASAERQQCGGKQRQQPLDGRLSRIDLSGPVNGFWRDADWLLCRDEKWRPVEPGTFPLADAGTFRNRVGLLRGAGNAITLGQAKAFIEAVMDSIDHPRTIAA